MKYFPLVITGENINQMLVSEKIIKQLLKSNKKEIFGVPFGKDILNTKMQYEFVEKIVDIRKITSGIKIIWENIDKPLSVNIYLTFKRNIVSSLYIIQKKFDFKDESNRLITTQNNLDDPFDCPITPIKEKLDTSMVQRRKSFYISPRRQSFYVSPLHLASSLSPGEIRFFEPIQQSVNQTSNSPDKCYSNRKSEEIKWITNENISDDFILPEAYKRKRDDDEDWVTNYRIMNEKELWKSYYL